MQTGVSEVVEELNVSHARTLTYGYRIAQPPSPYAQRPTLDTQGPTRLRPTGTSVVGRGRTVRRKGEERNRTEGKACDQVVEDLKEDGGHGGI